MSQLTCGHIQHMYSWWWVTLSPETCRLKAIAKNKNAIVASCWAYFTYYTGRYELRPAVKKAYLSGLKVSAFCILVVSRVFNRTLMSFIESYGYTKCPAIYSFIVCYVIHNHMCRYRTAEWYRRCTVGISWYSLNLSPIKEKKLGKTIGTICS